MAREDRLVDDLRSIFNEARRSSGQVQAEALLAAAPVVLKNAGGERDVAYMRDRLTPESYQAICRAIGDELDRLNGEITRLRRFEKIAGVVEKTKRQIFARPPMVAKSITLARLSAPAAAPASAAPAPAPTPAADAPPPAE